MAILDQRAIPYTDVQVHSADLGVPQDHFAYVAAVVVEAEPPAYGKIACLSSAGDCGLWIEALGIDQVPLPTPAAPPPWVAWIKHPLHTLERSLRAWLARAAQRSMTAAGRAALGGAPALAPTARWL